MKKLFKKKSLKKVEINPIKEVPLISKKTEFKSKVLIQCGCKLKVNKYVWKNAKGSK